MPTANGAPLTVQGAGTGVTVGGATLVVPDVAAANGVIHGIDHVLLPPS